MISINVIKLKGNWFTQPISQATALALVLLDTLSQKL
jgi:hypothetical protein